MNVFTVTLTNPCWIKDKNSSVWSLRSFVEHSRGGGGSERTPVGGWSSGGQSASCSEGRVSVLLRHSERPQRVHPHADGGTKEKRSDVMITLKTDRKYNLNHWITTLTFSFSEGEDRTNRHPRFHPERSRASQNTFRYWDLAFAFSVSPRISAFTPKLNLFTHSAGKIMRRVLRQIARNEKDLGDLSTLADPKVVEVLFSQRCEAAA